MENEQVLAKKRPVEVRINGQPVKRLLYKPDFIELSKTERDYQHPGSLELHDCQESLTSGSVSFGTRSSVLEETFTKIFQSRKDKETITNLDTSQADSETKFLSDTGENLINLGGFIPDPGGREFFDFINEVIEFDGDSPLAALEKAKRLHSVDTRVNLDGTLVVGSYPGSDTFTASPVGYQTDLQIKSSSISGPSKYIEGVLIKGPAKDTLSYQHVGDGFVDNLSNIANIATDRDNYRMYITAENPNVDGVRKVYEAGDMYPRTDKMIDLAKRKYSSLDIDSTKAEIKVSLTNSNIDLSENKLQIGDKIEIKKPEKDCLINGSMPASGEYFITNIRHEIGTSWDVTLGLSRPRVSLDDLNIEISYYNTRTDSKATHKDVYGYPKSSAPEVYRDLISNPDNS